MEMINQLLFSKMDRLSSKKISDKHTSCTHTPNWSRNQGNPSEKRSVACVNMQRKKDTTCFWHQKLIITILMLCNRWIAMDCAWFPPSRTLYTEFRSFRCEFCNYQTHPGPSCICPISRSNPNMYDRQMGFGIKWQRWGSFQLSDWINSLLIFSERCL